MTASGRSFPAKFIAHERLNFYVIAAAITQCWGFSAPPPLFFWRPHIRPVTESLATKRPIMLPAVLQIEGDAPCFGTIDNLTDHGLIFNFQDASPAQQRVGHMAKLDFDVKGQHHTCSGLIVHIQEKQALLSLRDAASSIHAALLSAGQGKVTGLASRLSTLQTQQACHARFMAGMKPVVETFYQLLPGEIQHCLDPKVGLNDQPEFAHLQSDLEQLRPQLVRHFTSAFPMYPEQLDSPLLVMSAAPDDPADMARVDEWISRTNIAQQVTKGLESIPDTFSRAYSEVLGGTHPYHPDAVLQLLSCLISPLNLGPKARALCYSVMGQAFQKQALALYQDLLQMVQETPSESVMLSRRNTSLEDWLSQSASSTHSSEVAGPSSAAFVNAGQVNELAVLLSKLTESLGDLNEKIPASSVAQQGAYPVSSALIPGLLARDRIFSHFLADKTDAQENMAGTAGNLAVPVLGGPSGLDQTALQSLYAAMRQQNPFELTAEKPSPSSQVRTLMLQAQGLLLEFTLNGLTYESEPNHPAWILVNALDALHLGVDIHGQFLDPALHQAISLSMQWLLGQENVDTALEQVNTLLAKINSLLRSERQVRYTQHLNTLGKLALDSCPISTGWCLVKNNDEAIPYEILGERDNSWVLLDRSATHLLEIPADAFLKNIDSGKVEETDSFDEPLLERIADASLTASLDAVHAFTWKDPASGCLKRTALMDELERRLAHPVNEPPAFCALIEIPTMRPGLSSLPGDELTVLQKRTGEILLAALESGEHCGRLSDVSFMMVFLPQDPGHLAARLVQLKTDMEALHPVWKMTGAVVPLADGETSQNPSSTLRRANLASGPARQEVAFDLSCLSRVPPTTNQIEPLPFSSLYLRCQKIESCVDGVSPHYEILLGVDDNIVPRHTTQSFVVMAEQTGNIQKLDNWVLRSALEWMDQNIAGMEQLSGLSINLSGNSLTDADHVTTMINLLGDYPHLAKKIILEITETAAIDNMDVAARSLRTLKTLGCRVALDDFGSGYSSYSYMRSLPLDYLKIDGTYIRNLLTNTIDQALTASMVDVAHALGLKVIAEYVDSEAVYTWLKNLSVDYVQGYWVHEPERLENLILR